MDRKALLKREIEAFDLRPTVRDFLLRRLSIASAIGVIRVEREFEEAKVMRRVELLPTYRRIYDQIQRNRIKHEQEMAAQHQDAPALPAVPETQAA